MNIKKIIVDEIPQNCGACPLWEYVNDNPMCFGVNRDVCKIEGNPYSMQYRRSDCPLQIERDDG